jgi:hypothetical protein
MFSQYGIDSPQAAARVIAICVLADGYVGRKELNALERARVCELLSLCPNELISVMQATRNDLTALTYPDWKSACHTEPAILHRLAAEIRDTSLRLKIAEFVEACLNIGWHATRREAVVLRKLREAWQLHAGCAWNA